MTDSMTIALTPAKSSWSLALMAEAMAACGCAWYQWDHTERNLA